jgi:hypothetical protein
VSSPAQIENAWLAAVDFRDHYDYLRPGTLWFDLEDSFEVRDLNLEDEETFVAHTELEVTVRWFDDAELTIEAPEWPFDLTLTVGGDFRFVSASEERFARTWLDYNGAYLLWPYARAYVASITSLGRLAHLTLETRRVPNPPDIESDEDARPAASQAES